MGETNKTAREMRWYIDAMNVIGSRPDGWWRDREGAVRRFVGEVHAWASGREADDEVIVVLDTGPDDLLGTTGAVTVRRAPRRGRDAADDEIARLAGAGDRVVTSDGGLAARVRVNGAETLGAGTFRDWLGSAP
jgi:hypothetical protein